MGAISWFLNFLIITALIFSHVSVVASFSAIPSNTIDHKFRRLPVKRKLRQQPSAPPPPQNAPQPGHNRYNELGSEEEDPQTVNDDKAISSDEPHPRKADVDDFEIIIHQCLGRFAIFDPNAATNMTVHPLSFFPAIVEFEIQQNAILASEETELQEKALVFQANSCMD
uniref:Uncharacterized protein n=1 Tax=Salix viminalis TaxID=40686 RepID=A0A6N2KR47_SALVM